MIQTVNQKRSFFLRAAVAVLLAVNMIKGGEMDYLLSVSEFIVIATVGVLLFWAASEREIRLRSSAVSLPAALFVGALSISSLLSFNSTSSFKGLHEVISYLLLFFLCLNLRSGRERTVFASMFIGVAAVQAVAATVQAGKGIERVAGSLVYPTYLVDTLMVGLSLLAGFLIFSKGKKPLHSVLSWALFLLLFVALFLTRARAGLPVLASSFVVLGVMKNRKVLLVLVIVVLAAAVIPNPVRNRVLDAGKMDIYAMKRPSIWKQAIDITRMKPSAGVGMRNYVYYSRRTNFPVEDAVGRYAKVAKIAHNEYLHYAATTGLAGLGAFLLLVGAILVTGWKAARARDPVSVGALAACVSFLVHGLVDNSFYLPLNGYLFFGVAGVLCSNTERSRVFRAPPRARIYVSVLALVYGLLVIRPAVSHRFYSRGIEKAGMDDIAGAIQSCRTALAISPREAVYHNALAKLYSKRYERTHGAGYMFISHTRHESAVRSNPLDRVFWEDFADFQYEHRRSIGEEEAYSNAAELLREAVRADPYNPWVRRKLALLYAEAGSSDKAVRELKGVLRLEPNFHSARFALAQTYLDLGFRDRAEEQYRVLAAKKIENLESRVQNEYERKLIEFDWSTLPPM